MELKQTIKRILREESNKDYTSLIESILTNLFVADHKDEICKVKVVHPREEMQLHRPEQYNVIFYFIGLINQNNQHILMYEAWDLVYKYTGQKISMSSDYVKNCGDIIQENKENSIPKMIKILGISDAIKYFGNYYRIEPYLKVTDKVNFIKEKVDEISEGFGGSGVGLSELYEQPIFYDEDDNELKQIEYLGANSVYVDVYNDGDSYVGDFRVTYESLPVEIIEQLVEILLNH